MLVQLSIRDIVLIEKLDIEFGRGLTVLTGETGAGKSILLDALSLALGVRGAGRLVRHGAEQGQVSAVFDLATDHPAFDILRENAIDADGELILRRVQTADGKTRGFVNDQPVASGLLAALGATLIEIHGQHDDRALVAPSAHRVLLDAFAGLQDEVADLATQYRTWRSALIEAEELRRQIAAGKAEAEYLRAAVEELRLLAPQPGEEVALAEKRQAMMRAEKIAGDVNEAYDTVAGSTSPIPTLGALVRRLERKRDQAGDLLDPAIAALDRSLAALQEASGALEAAMRLADYDPKELERTEERLFALRAAARKHNVQVDALADLAARMAADLDTAEAGEDRLAAIDARAEAARLIFDEKAKAISAARRKAAARLEKAVGKELPALKLERAAFMVEFGETEPGEAGVDRIEFWVRTNPGAPPGPLMKIASGGELSRFLLALKVALADRGSAPTLIFDEVDTAVGGAVADAIGQRLARLAGKVQVLSVTHAPQVAARADAHVLVQKGTRAKRAVTEVEALDNPRRREEIARMLAGSVVTDEARAAAERLILGAA
jgi:DNA repair protein RecN (Recombination protein N)